MKRFVYLILCILLLCGCSSRKPQESTTFYYCKVSTTNDRLESLLVPEQRELSASDMELNTLLSLYLIGPQDEEMVSPFRGMKLISALSEDAQITVELHCNDTSLTDARFSLASACITMTCLDFADASQVTVHCGNRTVTMNRENLLIADSVTSIDTITEETQ